ncbi:winged helix-turn-helix domain-containing protein [Nocardioides currus]|uniref:Winged helix-turn-helix domain-containing protein n=1 Tax=Nocardioides currus TaxID=2133958 RepID=A0A2R7YT99_9ACTN|nr:winged helix-turn-helix domain-containing protein [Nocardioides currus]
MVPSTLTGRRSSCRLLIVYPVHELTKEQARRISVLAQLLDAERPDDLLEMVRHLTLLQVEPTAAVAPSAHVVAWSRLGAGYRQSALDDLVGSGALVELHSMLRPAEDLALHRAEMAAWPSPVEWKDWERSLAEWVEANDDTRRDILAKLHDEGPCTTRELPDTTLVPWQSSGWNNDRNVSRLLDMMVQRGEVAVAGMDGRDKLWDLAERVYPDVEPVPLEEAMRIRGERRLRSLGLARARAAVAPSEPNDVGPVGEDAVVEGVRGRWRVDPTYLARLDDFSGRAALLSPLDRLVFDRKRMEELFEFDYQLEMYKPKAKRRFGYWALPVLYGDRLVGKVDATAERDAGILRVDAVHEDGRWTKAMRTAVGEEIDSLGDWLGLVVT